MSVGDAFDVLFGGMAQLGPGSDEEARLDHPDEAVRGLAGAILREIEVLRASEASYGYVFLVLQRS